MSQYYSFPEAGRCGEKILEYFKFLPDDYQYQIVEQEIRKFYVSISYANFKRKISITNQTNYTDYGFSIFVHNLENIRENLYEIVINIPFAKQDKECEFVKKASEYLKFNYDKLIAREDWSRKYTGALLLYVIFSTEGEGGSAVKDIIAYIDYINHAIITFEEFSAGINYLLRNGLVTEKNHKYFTSLKYKQWYEHEYKNCKRISREKVIEKIVSCFDAALGEDETEIIKTAVSQAYFAERVNEYKK